MFFLFNPTSRKINFLPSRLLFVALFFIASLTYAQKPIITSFSPASGAAGSYVVITGNNFSKSVSNDVVFFGAVRATVVSSTATSMKVRVPPGANFAPLSITVNRLTAFAARPFILTFPDGGSIEQTSLAPKQNFAVSGGLSALTAADLNADGKVDFILPNYNDYSLTILQNTSKPGLPSFAAPVRYAIDIMNMGMPESVAVGDFNGDGKPDIVLICGGVFVYKNTGVNGMIAFAAPVKAGPRRVSANLVQKVTTADIDGDGKTDLVYTNYDESVISVMRNTSSGDSISFAAKVDLATGIWPISVTIVDIDGDGKPDIASSGDEDAYQGVSLHRNTSTPGSISFQPKVSYQPERDWLYVEFGDLDGDGKPDMAISKDSVVSVYANTSAPGNFNFIKRKDYHTLPGLNYNVAIADMDGDSKPDLNVTSASSVCILKNVSSIGNISFNTGTDFSTGRGFTIFAGDMDGDAKPDIITTNEDSSYNVFLTFLRNKVNEPVITSFTPTSGGEGTQIKIKGKHFTTALDVRVGGTVVNSYNIDSSTSITATIAQGTSGTVSVKTKYGIATLDKFTYTGPKINSFTPAMAAANTVITINGVNFAGVNFVSFGGVKAKSFTIVSPFKIAAVVGNGSTGNVSVTTALGTATHTGFTFTGSTGLWANNNTAKLTDNVQEISVYPNPAKGFFILKHPLTTERAEIRLTDVNGKVLKAFIDETTTTQTSVDIYDLPAGFYFIAWNNGKQLLRKSIEVK